MHFEIKDALLSLRQEDCVCVSDAFVRVGMLFIIRKREVLSLSLSLSLSLTDGRVHFRLPHLDLWGWRAGTHTPVRALSALLSSPAVIDEGCLAQHRAAKAPEYTGGNMHLITHVPPLPLLIPNHRLLR